jgi:hypothetical protein
MTNAMRMTLCLVAGAASACLAQEAAKPEEVLRQVAETKAKAREIEKRMQAASEAIRDRSSAVSCRVQELEKPYDPERVERWARELREKEERLAFREAMLPVARIESAEARAAKRAECKAQREEAERRIRAAVPREKWTRIRQLKACEKALEKRYSKAYIAKLQKAMEQEEERKARRRGLDWGETDGFDHLLEVSQIQPLADRAARKAECERERNQIEKEIHEATDEDRLTCSRLSDMEHELNKPYDPNRVAELVEYVDRARRERESVLASWSNASVPPPERAARRAEAEAELKRVRQEARDVEGPFRKELDDLRKQCASVAEAIQALVQPAIRIPTGLEATDADISADPVRGDATVVWRTADKEMLATAQLVLSRGPNPGRAAGREETRVTDAFSAYQVTGTHALLWAGPVNVVFAIRREDWQNRELVVGLLPEFLDLDALAALPKLNTTE